MVEYQLPKLGTRVRFPSLAPGSLIILLCSAVLLAGCSTVDYAPPVTYERTGVYHTVRKGETVFRIAKTYQVAMDEIIAANKIQNVETVKENQRLFIPGATQEQAVPALVDSTNKVNDPNKDEFAWPVRGRVLNYFGQTKRGFSNRGISIRVNKGQDIKAARQGKVIFADYISGFANTVILDHQDGYYSVYAHNERLETSLGTTVNKGDTRARAGAVHAIPFLHFEIRRNGLADNPLYYLPKL